MWYNSTISSQNWNCGKMTTNIAPFFSSVEPMDVRDPKVTTAGTVKSHSKQPIYSFASYKDLVRFEDSIHQDIQIKT